MTHYKDYLPELLTTTMFRDMTDEEILLVLDNMQPAIKKGRPEIGKGKNVNPNTEEAFRMVIRSSPAREQAPRHFKYDMPKFGEPGMLMAEIPVLSRMLDYVKPQGRPRPPIGNTPDLEMETLEFTPEMITKFYNPEVSKAQGKMLRNMLGILSQKVCNIRHELFLLRDGRDMYAGLTMPENALLHVMTAGVAMNVAQKAVRIWNATHPELPAECKAGGSVDLIRRVQSGEPCDVLIIADENIIDSMMIPEHASGYRIFAGNKMVVMGSKEHPISKDDWKEKLLAPYATFGHFSPYGDPGGYRAVMTMILADGFEEGLANKLLNHPGHRGMEREPQQGKGLPMYTFGYYSGAISRDVPFAELPPVMDLSDDALAETYSKACFAIDEEHTVTAAPIAHALTIPKASKNREAAKAFARMFMATDFPEAGFLNRTGLSGEDPLA